MIAFDLQCSNGHTFEGWFEDGQSYEKQMEQGLITCPICEDTSVSKIPSTFAIKMPHKGVDSSDNKDELAVISNNILNFIEKNFDDVGCDFAKEALKMHYGVNEPKNIRGVSSREEEKILEKEGVQFYKISVPTRSDTEI
ncbi:MAG: DUF1178 family protein [Proteobacteria bacterium]|nr:DUF1178 family protein [Pseudomonadota bacterium]MBU4259521.1 DUF1178 family protein [Pseudomonadota bacterium]MBU4289178.1 DUF1178 family protein [Pseudomonadota bacterium]MBU4414900.1 DUF1178 family protein [Pseudomonadota bacterium]MCG2758284.1 DUF1178 family protein [Desulfobacteraceae bacterium]